MHRGEAKKRDLQREQQLVRDLWQQVEARIDISGALRAFLTQKIDDCGQTIEMQALLCKKERLLAIDPACRV